MEFELRNIISKELVHKLGTALLKEELIADLDEFISSTMLPWPSLSLTQRVSALRIKLEESLDSNYLKARLQLRKLAPEFSFGYEYIFFPEYIAHNGLDYPKKAMEDLAFVTQFSSSEFAVRSFIESHEDLSMKMMLLWTKNENEHVRRLASEGCRPSLPWGKALNKFKKDPSPIFPILNALMKDPSLYVRKSVANNLNDISKFHPELVLDFAKSWSGTSKNVDWILKRALRTLLKEGRPEALILFGYGDSKDFELSGFKLGKQTLSIGEKLPFQFDIRNKSKNEKKLRLEYRIDYLKKSGSYSTKTFQLKETKLDSKDYLKIEFKQHFKQLTTRKHYPGKHFIRITINGVDGEKLGFELKPML